MALLKDSVVTGDLRVTNNLYSTTAQFQILKAPSTSGGTDYGIGTAGYMLKTGTSGVYWAALIAADIPNLAASKITSGTFDTARIPTNISITGSAGSVAWGNVSNKPIDFIVNTSSLNSNGWKTLGGRGGGAKIAISYCGSNPASWNSGPYSASLVFGCSDTKGLLDCDYNTPTVIFGGGSVAGSTDNDPKWYFKISGTSGKTYTFPTDSKTLAATDGTGASGTWGINITGTSSNVTGTVAIANGGTGASTTAPHNVFVGPATGTSNGAPSFRELDKDDLLYFKTRIIGGKVLTSAGWYRILDCTTYSMSFFITFWGGYNNQPPTPVTFLVSHSYSATKIEQIGKAAYIGWITKIRAIHHDTSKFYIDIYYSGTAGNEASYEITPLDPKARNSITKVDYTLITDELTPNAICETTTTSHADIANSCTGTAAKATADADNNTISSTYLKKSGGTMTGVFTAKGSQYDDSITSSTSHAINMNNSNIIGLNAIYTADASDNAAEGINFYRDATHFDTLWMSGGDLLFVPNRALGTNTTKADSQKVGRFTANPTTNQVVITDGTTGGMKSSGYTIAKSVPSDAKFTDTTYSAGTGISLSGTTFSNSGVTSIAGKTGAVTLADLGLSQALRFIGKASTEITETTTTAPTITGITSYTPQIGDVVLDSSSDAEFVCVGINGTTYTWERLGRDSSWALDNAVIHNTLVTTKGDIIYASTASTPARLAIGTGTNKFLTVNNGVPAWGAVAKSDVGLGNVTNDAQIPKSVFTEAYQILYSTGSSTYAVLTANKSTTKKFLRMTGASSSAGAAPAWDTVTSTDVGLGNVSNNSNLNSVTGSKGDIIYWSSANTPAHLTNTNSTTKQALTITSQVPSWVDISPSITIGAGTDSAAPTVNVTVLGQSGTAKSITTASTSAYGVTKLNDGIASDSTDLAATANSALIAAKKTASSNNALRLYLTGARVQDSTGVDSYSYLYTYTENGLLSALKVGLNLEGTEKAHMEWNNTDQTIDFVFA